MGFSQTTTLCIASSAHIKPEQCKSILLRRRPYQELAHKFQMACDSYTANDMLSTVAADCSSVPLKFYELGKAMQRAAASHKEALGEGAGHH